jgi:SAM-dependent methyltransferase
MEHFYHNIGEDWMDFHDLYTEAVDYYPDGSHFVEIGCWKGRSSAYLATEIANSGKRIKLDCVDTWDGSEEHLDPNSPFYVQQLLSDKDWLYFEFIKNIFPAKEFINPIRCESLKAANLYEDRSLDFVFIDAAHDYTNVMRDILSWYPKVKKGGIISGHDYTTYTGVKLAVDEFFQGKEISFNNSYWFHRK